MSDSFCSELLREMENALEDQEEDESELILDLQYEIIEGLREGSSILWTPQEQQLYYRNSFSNKTQLTAYTCRIANCKARVFVKTDNTAFRSTIRHQHGSQYKDYKQMYCEKQMKARAKSAPASMSPYDIYMEAVADWQKDPLCEGTPYPKLFSEFKKTLSNLRAQKYGNAPTNGKEIKELIERNSLTDLEYSLIRDEDGKLQKLLNDVVMTDKFENCIFSSPKTLSLIKEFTKEEQRFFIIDGTFRITPKGIWQQILILQINFGLKSFPLAYILMSKRTIEAYKNVFEYIHNNLIPLRGDAIILDFEKGMRTALKQVLKKYKSNMSILGCWFHYCQALRRHLVKLSPLCEKVKNNEKFSHIFRRFQCLPLLPLQHIETSFRELSKEALKLDLDLFQPFIKYYNKEWMKIVTPLHFCVYLRGKRTTGDAESYNARLNKLFRTHGNFFHFVEVLQKMEASTSNQLQNYVDGIQQKDCRSSFYKKRSKLIHNLMLEHKDSPKLLLNALANVKNKILYAENEIVIDKEDVEMAEDIELCGNDDITVYNEISDYDNFTFNFKSRSRTVSSTINENDKATSSRTGSMSDLALNENVDLESTNNDSNEAVSADETISQQGKRGNKKVQKAIQTRSRSKRLYSQASVESDEGISSRTGSMSDLASNENVYFEPANDSILENNEAVSADKTLSQRGKRGNKKVQKAIQTRSRSKRLYSQASVESDEGISSRTGSMSDLATNENDEANSAEEIVSNNTRRQLRSQRADSEPAAKRPRMQSKSSTEDKTTRQKPQTGSENLDNNLPYFSRVTRSGNSILKLVQRIDRIMNDEETVDVDCLQCIICCNSKKSIILLPCRHQHVCEACWTLWRMECINKEANRSFNESDDDDDVLKPTCPYCNAYVETSIKAIN